MKTISTAIECRKYVIMEHPDVIDSFDSSFDRDVVEKTRSLRCDFTDKDFVEQRDKSHEVDASLLKAAYAACRGEDKRWRLMAVEFYKDQLILAFADLETKKQKLSGDFDYAGAQIWFGAAHLIFSISVNRSDSCHPDDYEVEFIGADEECRDSDGNLTVADIDEYRYGEWYAIDHLVHRADGKYYLERLKFDE